MDLPRHSGGGLGDSGHGGVKRPGSHSCARHWLQSGLNVNAVSAWLGHSSLTVTLNSTLRKNLKEATDTITLGLSHLRLASEGFAIRRQR